MIASLHFPRTESEHQVVAEWVMRRLGVRAAKPYRAIGMLADGELVAGVVFNGYNGANVDVSVYAPGHLTGQALAAVFRYAFDVLRCTRITARTRRGNPLHKQQLLLRMGFRHEATSAQYYGPKTADDAIVYRMLRRECPWLGDDDNGRAESARPRGYSRSPSGHEQGNGYCPEGAE